MKKQKHPEGWAFPGRARKCHYFVGGKALCRQWVFGGPLEEGNDDSPDNCTQCVKLLAQRKAGGKEPS